MSRLQYEESASNLAQQELALTSTDTDVAQLFAQRELSRSKVQSQRAQLQQSEAQLLQQSTDLAREIDQLELAVEQSTLRAPERSVVGAMADVAAGGTLAMDQWLLTLVPEQASEFRAYFDAQIAGGRIQVGQPAQIQLYALPWVEYGTLTAEVLRVSQVAMDDQIEVVFGLDGSDPLQARAQRGFAGRVSVEVTSLTLLQRFLRLLSLVPESS